MTIDEAIKHCADIISDSNIGIGCAAEHIQLMEWLKELKFLRKRTALDEKSEGEKLMNELMEIYDNVQAAIDACGDVNGEIKRGISLIGDSILRAMKSRGYEKIPCEPGDDFDARYHEALYAEKRKNIPPYKIYEVVRTGWKVEGKVVKPSGVFVTI